MRGMKSFDMDSFIGRLASEVSGGGVGPGGVARLRRCVLLALLLGTAAVAATVLVFFGGRSDIFLAVPPDAVFLKFLVPFAIAASGFVALIRMSQPGLPAVSAGVVLPLGAAVLLATLLWSSGGAPLATLIAEGSVTRCVAKITCLSLIPMFMLLEVLKSGAPTRPGLTAAIAGATSGAGAAFGYALYCPVDSTGFVLVAYLSAIALSAALGVAFGRRRLAW